jgi:hypothetical protein
MGYASDFHRTTRIRREALRQVSVLEDDGGEALPSLDELARAVLEQAERDVVSVDTDCN